MNHEPRTAWGRAAKQAGIARLSAYRAAAARAEHPDASAGDHAAWVAAQAAYYEAGGSDPPNGWDNPETLRELADLGVRKPRNSSGGTREEKRQAERREAEDARTVLRDQIVRSQIEISDQGVIRRAVEQRIAEEETKIKGWEKECGKLTAKIKRLGER